MKIYYMDCGWAGSIMVIASSQEEAHKLSACVKENNIQS